MFSKEQLSRYSRHFVLPQIGVSGQKKLKEASVLVIGAGALGSISLMYLAAAGVGTIGIADYDTVDISNLQRQVIYRISDIGADKTKSAQRAITKINPDIQVIIYNTFVTADNISAIISDYDFIIDGTDRFETKFLINDACVLNHKPYSHAGIIGFEGQTMTYIPDESPCLRCVLSDIPKNSQTCSQAGVVGAAVGVLGSVQALESIKYIIGQGKLLTGRLLKFDGLNMEFRTIKSIPISSQCRVCGNNADIVSLSNNRKEYEIQCIRI